MHAWLDAQPRRPKVSVSWQITPPIASVPGAQAQRPHGGQLPLKLPLGCRRGKRLKQVWQLYPMDHDGLGRFVPQVFTDKQTIVGVEEHVQRLGSAQESVREGLKQTQGEECEEG